eukprot:1961607-Amphidinium_carterae.1
MIAKPRQGLNRCCQVAWTTKCWLSKGAAAISQEALDLRRLVRNERLKMLRPSVVREHQHVHDAQSIMHARPCPGIVAPSRHANYGMCELPGLLAKDAAANAAAVIKMRVFQPPCARKHAVGIRRHSWVKLSISRFPTKWQA